MSGMNTLLLTDNFSNSLRLSGTNLLKSVLLINTFSLLDKASGINAFCFAYLIDIC